MALCHHTIVHWASIRVNPQGKTFSAYWILGDDIVIHDEKVALEYLKIINELGMDIAMEKSLVSCDTFEFAKRIFHQGQEFSH